MQFDYQHKAGQEFVKVVFIAELFSNTKFKQIVIDQMSSLFNRIGGTIQEDYSWHFPIFVSSNLLKEIIHNTCFVCGGLMGNSAGFKKNKTINIEDYTLLRKCNSCGHSHT